MNKTPLNSFLVPIALVLNSYAGSDAAGQTIHRARSSAIFNDPQRDARHPSWNEAVWIPSGGVLINGVMYAASGVQPHPTVMLLHGLPGNEQNLDLAQSLRRSGFDVLAFHYRGSWGSPGKFTLAGGADDGQAAFAFLENPATVAKFHVDLKRLIVIGHSYGGFVAVRVAAAHPSISAAVLLAPWSPAGDIPQFSVPAGKFAAAAHAAFDDVEGRLGGYTDVDLAREILQSGYDWRLESSADAIRNLPLLILTARHDSADDQADALISQLQQEHAPKVATTLMDTDHAFSDHRIALQQAVLGWLRRRGL